MCDIFKNKILSWLLKVCIKIQLNWMTRSELIWEFWKG